MPPRLRTALAVSGSLALGGGLLWLALRGVDFGRLAEMLGGADWRWLPLIVVVTLLSHAVRAWRWTLLLDTLPNERPDVPRPGFGLAFASTMIGYLVNAAVPRGGEVARAGNLAARSGLGFAGVMGTVVVERVLDVLTLAAALLTLPVLFRGRLGALYAAVGERMGGLADAASAVPWGLALAGLAAATVGIAGVAAWLRRRRRAGERRGGKLGDLLRQFRAGLSSLGRVRRRGALAASTLAIWFCYLLMADLPLRLLGLSERYGLSLLDAWGVMNVGAIGMALPAPGGTGSYHYAVVQALGLLCAVPETPAAAYALLTHAAQLGLFAVVGVAALLLQGARVGRAAPPDAAG